MPTLGTELISYTGNSGLGAGSGAPVVGEGDNSVINQTNRDLMLMNHENNVRKYEQKIKDRDNELKMLSAGKVQTGEVLPQDRKLIDDLQAQNDKNYFNLISINDKNSDAYKQAYAKYQSGLRDTQDAATWAQHRYVGRKKLESEKASQTLDEDQKAYQNHLDQQDKLGFWNGDYSPFQKSLDFDADSLHQKIIEGSLGSPSSTTNKKTVTSRNGVETVYDTQTTTDAPTVKQRTKGAIPTQQLPLKSESKTFTRVDENGKVFKVTESNVDFDTLKNNSLSAYNYGGKDAQQMMMLRDKVEQLPEEVYSPYMQHILKRADDYNNDLGLKPGDKNYINTKQLAAKLGVDPVTGKRTSDKIMMTTPDFAAIETLAQYNGSYKQTADEFDKEQTAANLKAMEERGKITVARINADAKKAAARMSKEGKIKVQELKNARGGSQDESKLRPIFDDVVGMSVSQKDGSYVVKAKDIPEGYKSIIGGIQVTQPDSEGKGAGKTITKNLEPRPDGTYKISNGAFMNGTLISPQQIEEAKNAFNSKNGTNLTGAQFLIQMSKDNLIKLAPAYIIGKDNQTVNLDQVMDAQKVALQPSVKKGQEVPTEITIENETVEQ